MHMPLTEVATLLYAFHWWFLIQICNILQWRVGSTVRYRKSGKLMIESVYSELKVRNLL